MLWTIVTTREYPPDDLDAFRREKAASAGIAHGAREIFRRRFAEMPRRCGSLALVQFFTWLGLFCMWLYFAAGRGAQRLRRTG